MKQEFKYQGFMSKEAQEFFNGKTITEERDGCAVVGTWIILENSKTHMPNKNDIFIKNEDGTISLKQ